MPAIDSLGNELKYAQSVLIVQEQTKGMLGLELPDSKDAGLIIIERGCTGIITWIPPSSENPFLVEVYFSFAPTRDGLVYVQTKHLKGLSITLENLIPEKLRGFQSKLEARHV